METLKQEAAIIRLFLQQISVELTVCNNQSLKEKMICKVCALTGFTAHGDLRE